MSHIFTVAINGGIELAHVQAPTKAKAKAFALRGVEAKRLTGPEVLSLVNAGIAIVDSETGDIVNGNATDILRPDGHPDQIPPEGVPDYETEIKAGGTD